MERRHTAQPIKCTDDDRTRTISGLGAIYYDGSEGSEYRLWDGAYERIMPGAFDRAVKEDDVRGLFNHDSNMVLGRTSSGTMKLQATSEGLRYDIEPGNTTVSKDVAEHIRRGDVSGSSFAFVVTQEEWRTETHDEEVKREIREIQEVTLYDVGPVTFPAYHSTTTETHAEARSAYEAYVHVRDTQADAGEPDDADGCELPGIDLETYQARVRAAQAD